MSTLWIDNIDVKVEILTFEMLYDYLMNFPKSVRFNRLGIIGSFARDNVKFKNDVDIMVDTEESLFEEFLLNEGGIIEHYIGNKYMLAVDFVSLDTVIRNGYTQPNINSHWYWQDGYKQMIEEVIWCEKLDTAAKDQHVFTKNGAML